MDGRCATCKWWDHDEQGMYGGKKTCLLTELIRDAHVHPDSQALATGEWSASLITAPDFGCTQHEPREDT